jgi:hypothetical protein
VGPGEEDAGRHLVIRSKLCLEQLYDKLAEYNVSISEGVLTAYVRREHGDDGGQAVHWTSQPGEVGRESEAERAARKRSESLVYPSI